MNQTPSRKKWVEVVAARREELTSEIDRVNLEIYLEEDAISYLKNRIEERDSTPHIHDVPGDFELETVLSSRKSRLGALQRLQKAIGAEMTLVGTHLKALKDSWPEMDEEVLKVLKYLFDAEQVNEK